MEFKINYKREQCVCCQIKWLCKQSWKDLLTSFEARIYMLMLLCNCQSGSKPNFLFFPSISCPVLHRIKWNISTLCAVSNSRKSRRGTTDSQYKFLFCFQAFWLQPSLLCSASFCSSWKKLLLSHHTPPHSPQIYILPFCGFLLKSLIRHAGKENWRTHKWIRKITYFLI